MRLIDTCVLLLYKGHDVIVVELDEYYCKNTLIPYLVFNSDTNSNVIHQHISSK